MEELDRVRELRRLAVMDTAPEKAFDDIVRTAARLCGTPISLVSLVDDRRQWFKARVGLDAQETPRDQAFCAFAIENPDEVMVVSDAKLDGRFAANPLVTADPNIRFYAGAPLVTSTGVPLGTLCVIDTRPRVLDDMQVNALQRLAADAVALIEEQGTVRELRRTTAAARTLWLYRAGFGFLFGALAVALISFAVGGSQHPGWIFYAITAGVSVLVGVEFERRIRRERVDRKARLERDLKRRETGAPGTLDGDINWFAPENFASFGRKNQNSDA